MSLAEVLVAIAILAVVMAGGYRLIYSVVRLRASAHSHYTAVMIANNRVERAKNIVFAELPLLMENRVAVSAEGVPRTEGPFHRTTAVEMAHGGDPRVAQVTVTVEVPTSVRPSGPRATESVSTLLTEYVEP